MEIVAGKLIGNLYAARGLILTVALLWGLAVIRYPQFLGAVPFMAGVALLLGVFVSCLGLLFSFLSRNSTRAMAGTVALGIFVGGGYLFCCCLPFGMFDRGPSTMLLSLCMPFLIAVPGVQALEWAMGDEGAKAMAAFVVGLIVYGVAALGLWGKCVGDFDRLSGRTHDDPFDLQRLKGRASAAAALDKASQEEPTLDELASAELPANPSPADEPPPNDATANEPA